VTRAVGLVLASALPLVLLCDPRANFYYDWHNHQWFVGYFGEFFRQHGAMPQALNAAQITGMPQPVFYGWAFYPSLALISAWSGAALALRLAAALALGFQFWAIYAAGRRTLRDRGVSFALAAGTGWGTYLLTNLFNRAALTEFFATTFLATAVAFGIAACGEVRRATAASFVWLAIGFGALAAGAHPPTALVGGMFCAGLLPPAMYWHWRSGRTGRASVGAALVAGGLAALLLSPWVYANVVLHDDLFILGKLRRFAYFPDRTENWLGRFAPFPHDGGSLLKGAEISTPYAEAQISWALILVAGWTLIVWWRVRAQPVDAKRIASDRALGWLAVAGLGWFVFTASMSLSRTLEDALRWLAPYVQFPTRFVSHANLGLLVAALGAGAAGAARGGYGRSLAGTSGIVGAAVALAAVGLGLKLTHAAVVSERTVAPQYAWRGDRAALVTSGRADAASDYAALRTLPQLLPRIAKGGTQVSFPVGDQGKRFGVAGEATVNLPVAGWVITNATIFRWGRLIVDGQEAPKASLAGQDFRLAVRLPAGAHTLRWAWQPDPIWRTLHGVALWALVLLLGGMAGAAAVALRGEWRSPPE
jgi:hypothetical protein